MTKAEILKQIDSAEVDESLKSMVKGFVEQAYDAGFGEGMRRGSEVMSKTMEMLVGSTMPLRGRVKS